MRAAAPADPAAGVPVPAPVTETPPPDRYCDLVLTGGVASGVVYPWAIVELARAYRFRRLGGSSVGAVAAALAAACEYGRCIGRPSEIAFEVMRRVPQELAAPMPTPDRPQRTRMESLFQAAPRGRRLLALAFAALAWLSARGPGASEIDAAGARRLAFAGWRHALLAYLRPVARRIAWDLAMLPFALVAVQSAWAIRPGAGMAMAVLLLSMVPFRLAWQLGVGLASELVDDLRHGVAANDLGLCRGRSTDGRTEGFTDWMHRGLQVAAGRTRDDPPLTFDDLWNAPRAHPDGGRSIDLQVVVANVSVGRPWRLPAEDPDDTLYYRPDEWAPFFPVPVMDALRTASRPWRAGDEEGPRALPAGRLPVVVAARLSLSFPLLFSAPPVWAIDHEVPVPMVAHPRRCRLSDGGLCSNFPVHLFDAAWPRWPTFGLWLTARVPDFPDRLQVWLPRTHREGRADHWIAGERPPPPPGRVDDPLAELADFGRGLLTTMKDWADRSRVRLPEVRNRVVRIRLAPGEGQLFVTMPGPGLMRMAHEYGTAAGRRLVQAYAPAADGRPTRAWRDQLYVRLQLLVDGLHGLLAGIDAATRHRAHTEPAARVLRRARRRPLARRRGVADPTAQRLARRQAGDLADALAQLALLERVLARVVDGAGYRAQPRPVLQLRPPV